MTSSIAFAGENNAYDYSFHTLVGNKPLPLADFKGKVLLIVNTASNCGFTPQYANLEKLYQYFKDRGFVVLAVPSNDFGKQESGSNQEIADFCHVNYNVSFPVAAKEVVSGTNAHPFYRWAKKQLGFGSAPKWNFHKYLINRKGEVVNYYYSTTSPDASRVVAAIEKALDESN